MTLTPLRTGADVNRRRLRAKRSLESSKVNVDGPKDPGPDGRVPDHHQTVRLDPRDLKVTWPIAIATLEQLSDWTVFALRLGTLALIKECVNELAQRDASAANVARLRELVEALAKLPYES